MYRIKRYFKNFFYWLGFGLLWLGAMIYVCLLSIKGILALAMQTVVAGLAATFDVLVEGQIYLDNIVDGFKRLGQKGKYVRNAICSNYLEKYAEYYYLLAKPELTEKESKMLVRLERYYFKGDAGAVVKQRFNKIIAGEIDDVDKDKNIFLDCINLTQRLKILNKRIKREGIQKEQKLKDKREISVLKKSLANLKSAFTMSFMGIDCKLTTESITQQVHTFIPGSECQRIQALIDHRGLNLSLSWILTIIGGLGSGFVTAGDMISIAQHFHWAIATSSAFPALVIPVAVLSAIALAVITYNAFTEVLADPEIQEKLAAFKYAVKQGGARSVFLVTMMVISVGLAIVATVSSFGTWQGAAKNSFNLLPKFVHLWNKFPLAFARFTRLTSAITVGAYALAILFFIITNSAKSIMAFDDIPKNTRKLTEEFKETLQKQNWGQRINPFTWIELILSLSYRVVFFVAHVLSVAVGGDAPFGVKNIKAMAAFVFVGAASEALEDGTYVVRVHSIAMWVFRAVLIATLITPLASLWEYIARRFHQDKAERWSFAKVFKNHLALAPKQANKEDKNLQQGKKQATKEISDQKVVLSPGFAQHDITMMLREQQQRTGKSQKTQQIKALKKDFKKEFANNAEKPAWKLFNKKFQSKKYELNQHRYSIHNEGDTTTVKNIERYIEAFESKPVA